MLPINAALFWNFLVEVNAFSLIGTSESLSESILIGNTSESKSVASLGLTAVLFPLSCLRLALYCYIISFLSFSDSPLSASDI